jgi:hypothetical protein
MNTNAVAIFEEVEECEVTDPFEAGIFGQMRKPNVSVAQAKVETTREL